MTIAALAALGLTSPSSAAPPPPPPPEQIAQFKELFAALSARRPPAGFKELEDIVAPDVKIYEAGQLVFQDRKQWFDHLRSFAGTGPHDPQGLSVSREAFYLTPDGAITVLEFLFPIPPKGMEGQVFYHPPFPLQLVTYHLDGARLVRVDYSKPMQSYDQWLKAPAEE